MLHIDSQLAERYSKALFSLGQDEGILSTLEKDMLHISEVLASSSELQNALKSPIISKEDKQSLLDTIITKYKLSKIIVNFIGVLIENDRIYLLPEIAEKFADLVGTEKGEIKASIVSAIELKQAQLDEIAQELSKSLNNKTVKLFPEVDANILGGSIITIGSKMFDGSLAGQIDRLQNAFHQLLTNNA